MSTGLKLVFRCSLYRQKTDYIIEPFRSEVAFNAGLSISRTYVRCSSFLAAVCWQYSTYMLIIGPVWNVFNAV